MDNIGIALGGGKAFSIPTMFVLFIIAIAIVCAKLFINLEKNWFKTNKKSTNPT